MINKVILFESTLISTKDLDLISLNLTLRKYTNYVVKINSLTNWSQQSEIPCQFLQTEPRTAALNLNGEISHLAGFSNLALPAFAGWQRLAND